MLGRICEAVLSAVIGRHIQLAPSCRKERLQWFEHIAGHHRMILAHIGMVCFQYRVFSLVSPSETRRNWIISISEARKPNIEGHISQCNTPVPVALPFDPALDSQFASNRQMEFKSKIQTFQLFNYQTSDFQIYHFQMLKFQISPTSFFIFSNFQVPKFQKLRYMDCPRF